MKINTKKQDIKLKYLQLFQIQFQLNQNLNLLVLIIMMKGLDQSEVSLIQVVVEILLHHHIVVGFQIQVSMPFHVCNCMK